MTQTNNMYELCITALDSFNQLNVGFRATLPQAQDETAAQLCRQVARSTHVNFYFTNVSVTKPDAVPYAITRAKVASLGLVAVAHIYCEASEQSSAPPEA